MENEEILKRIGQRIATLRKEKGWTQVQFSEMVGIKRSSLARIETGKVNCTILTLQGIAEQLSVPLTDLI
jgi:transcriptional regulator with XRE-family HTH domain